VNLLAIAVLILCILVAVVVFRWSPITCWTINI